MSARMILLVGSTDGSFPIAAMTYIDYSYQKTSETPEPTGLHCSECEDTVHSAYSLLHTPIPLCTIVGTWWIP